MSGNAFTAPPVEEAWAELGDLWWSRYGSSPVRSSALYTQVAHAVPGFEYDDITYHGRVTRFGVHLGDRYNQQPRLGPFRLHRVRFPRTVLTWSLHPYDRDFPIHVERANAFVEGLTPEAYAAVNRAAQELMLTGRLVEVENAALEPDDPDRFGFELDGVLLPRFVAEPRVIHDVEWKTTSRLVAELEQRIANDAQWRWEQDDTRRSCRCGCGGEVQPTEFLPGHNARHRGNLLARARRGDAFAAEELFGRGWCSIERYRELVIEPQLFKRGKRS